MKDIDIRFHDTDSCDDATDIITELRAYNISNIGPSNRKGLTISIRKNNGELIAGLIGYTHWEWLFINILWVKESCRGQNLGTKLVMEAEKLAKERGCFGSHLDTFDFQAPGFYKKLDYRRFGEILDCPVKGKKRIFFKKYFN